MGLLRGGANIAPFGLPHGGCTLGLSLERDPMSATTQSLYEKDDVLELKAMAELDRKITAKSLLYRLADGDRSGGIAGTFGNGITLLMGEDPRLPKMPEKPTLMDFFRCRFAEGRGFNHLLQSANLAQKNGLPEKMVMACLLHDIAVVGFIRSDHGYWGAQMIEPYVDEEVSWAIRMHQALRFFPDESVGYAYPEQYIRMLGAEYKPDPFIVEEYNCAKNHKWYMSARQICLNDLYSFDPNVHVTLEQFEDVIGRNWKQPKEGLGNDHTPATHMWRTLRRPCNAL